MLQTVSRDIREYISIVRTLREQPEQWACTHQTRKVVASGNGTGSSCAVQLVLKMDIAGEYGCEP